jgi:hypothetical protein
MPNFTLFGPGEQKTEYSTVDQAVTAGYEVQSRQRDFVFAIVDKNDKPLAVHLLVLNPKSFTFDEPAAVNALETRGGLYTETKGVANRTLSISGTMGVMPLSFMPKDTGSLFGGLIAPAVEGFNNMLDSLSRFLGATPLQGYQEYDNFRKKIIHEYYARKRAWSEGNGEPVFLVLYVVQDMKRYTLEPARFSLNRTSSTPFTYPYTMQFSVITEDESDQVVPDARDFFDVFADGVAAFNECESFFSGESGLNEAGANATAFAGLVNYTMEEIISGSGTGSKEQMLEFKSQLPQNWQQFWGDFNDTGGASFASIGAEKSGSWNEGGGKCDRYIEKALDGLDEIKSKQSEFGIDQNDAYFLAQNLGSVDADAIGTDPFASYPASGMNPLNIVHTIRESIHAMCAIKSAGITAAIRAKTTASTNSFVTADTRRNKMLSTSSPISSRGYAMSRPSRGGSAGNDYYGYDYLSQQGIGLVPVAIRRGDQIEDIALRYMGDITRYKIIALVNNLHSPYIGPVADVQAGVLGYGDFIMVPMPIPELATSEGMSILSDDYDSHSKGAKVFSGSKNLTDIDRFFGIDVYYDWKVSDVTVNRRGDLGVAVRERQVLQFLQMLVNVEKGTWKLDKAYGLQKAPGFMSTRVNLAVWSMNIRKNLTSDPRIKSVKSLHVTQQANTVWAFSEIVLNAIGKTVGFRGQLSA